MTAIDKIIKRHFQGDTAKLCKALDVTKGAVSQWRKNGIPPLREFQIKQVTQQVRK